MLVRLCLLCLVAGSLWLCGCAGGNGKPEESPVPTAPSSPKTSASAPGPTDPDAPKEFSETASGLKYRILRKSDKRKPTAANYVTVNYRGWLDDGKEFDSSYQRREPTGFPLGGVIAGWTEGMQLVGEGGMIELEIPAELGYGASGSPGAIPPNATLHFIVELLEVK